MRAVFHGQGGHSALAPKFLNALHIAGDFLAELRKIQDTLAMVGARDDAYDIPYSTVHVGQISGGTALNIVPDSAEMIFEYRHLPADLPQGILERIQNGASKVLAPFLRHFPDAVVCGPGSMEGQGHKPDEFITLKQLALCDQMMDRLLGDLSGATDS